MKATIAWLACCLVGGAAHGGILGPSNYEECVLEKMKGQQQYMLSTAREACQKAFPDKSTEGELDNELIKYDWCNSSSTLQTICIRDQPKNYKITRVDAIFFTEDCATKQNKSGVAASGEKKWLSSNFEFKTPPAKKYSCVVPTFYGFDK